MATKPSGAGGAYVNRMSDFCDGCRYDPRRRVGRDACPYTGECWSFLAGDRERLAGNARVRQALRGLHRLGDLDELIAQEEARGTSAP